jgi:hypothetical protein
VSWNSAGRRASTGQPARGAGAGAGRLAGAGCGRGSRGRGRAAPRGGCPGPGAPRRRLPIPQPGPGGGRASAGFRWSPPSAGSWGYDHSAGMGPEESNVCSGTLARRARENALGIGLFTLADGDDRA